MEKNPTTFLSILTRLIRIWTKATHFFIQVVKPIIILWILVHTLRGPYVYDPIFHLFFLPITKLKELSTTLSYI